MKCIVSIVFSAAALFAADFNTGQAARAVVGQPQFTRQDATPTDMVIGGASGVAYANNMLFVADSNRVGASPSDNRVLIYKQCRRDAQDAHGRMGSIRSAVRSA